MFGPAANGRRLKTWMVALLLAAPLLVLGALPDVPGPLGFIRAISAADPPVNRAAPELTGDFRIGRKLTCSRGVWDDEEGHRYDITWRFVSSGFGVVRDWSDDPTYQLVDRDRGYNLHCEARADGRTTAASRIRVFVGPINLVAPQISGDFRVGRALTCSRGTWDDQPGDRYAVTYRWISSGFGEVSAPKSDPAYVVQARDRGYLLRCVAIAENRAEAHSAPFVAEGPVNEVRPTISGDLRVGRTLSCSRGDWDDNPDDPYTVTYRWTSSGFGEVSAPKSDPTYVVQARDRGYLLRCEVAADGLTSATSDAVVPSGPINKVRPSITGDHRVGRTVTCSRGDWDDRPGDRYAMTWRWVSSGFGEVRGPSGDPTFTIRAQDHGYVLSCIAIADGLSEAVSQGMVPPGPVNEVIPAITGDRRVGRTLTCSKGDWDDVTADRYDITWRWISSGFGTVQGTDALQPDKFVVRPQDRGYALRCQAIADGITSADSRSIVPPGPVNRSAPSISGDIRVGRTLTCSRGDWDDAPADPYTVTWRWISSGFGEVRGVSSDPNFTIRPEDRGYRLRCEAIADGMTASSSPDIVPPGPVNLSAPTLRGIARAGETMRCGRGAWDDQATDPYTITYRWESSGFGTVQGASASPDYLVRPQDVGYSLTCIAIADGLSEARSPSVVPADVTGGTPRPPALEGSPKLQRELTCVPGTTSTTGTLSYAWQRDGTTVDGRTAATYEIGADDVGHQITCVLSLDGVVQGESNGLVPTPPRAIIGPALSGDPHLGATLTCSRGEWDDEAGNRYPVAYSWYRDSTLLSDTGATHVVGAADVGKTISCTVRAGGLTDASTSGLVVRAPENLITPAISGAGRIGTTLTCSRGVWDDAGVTAYNVTYRWLREGTALPGETDATYVATAADATKPLVCEATAEGVTSIASQQVVVPAPSARIAPGLTGIPRAGGSLTCSRGEWDDSDEYGYAVSYRWRRDGDLISGATTNSLAIAASDVGTTIACEVVAEGLTSASTELRTIGAPTALAQPAVSGVPRIHRTLTCSRGEWDDDADVTYPVTYRWERNGTAIAAADTAQHVIVAADLGTQLRCVVRAADVTDSASQVVTVEAPRNLLAPVISGEPRLRAPLICTGGDWDDTSDARYALTTRWLRGTTEVGTGDTYTVATSDLGGQLHCEVTAEGTTTASSPAVAVVAPANVLAPALSGAARIGGQLHCDRGTWNDGTGAASYSVTYQWLRAGTPIVGATTPELAVTRDMLNLPITCQVTAEGLATSVSAAARPGPPRVHVDPAISGTPMVNRELSCSRGEWDDLPGALYTVRYGWTRNNSRIPDENGSTYAVGAADVGTALRCVVEAEGLVTAPSAAVAPSFAPVQTTLDPITDAVDLGGRIDYHLAAFNPNDADATATAITVTLPAGATYIPGSTTGATSADPFVNGNDLVWFPNQTLGGGSDVTLDFAATAPSTAGAITASARVDVSPGTIPSPATGPTARVEVCAADDATGCTVTGTEAEDVLTGTDGPDVVCGLGGDDELEGFDGADELRGGAGDDRLAPGSGDDKLLGGRGNDVLLASAGADALSGGPGTDLVSYADRSTSITVSVGLGTPGDDGDGTEQDTVDPDVERVRGGAGDDTLVGGDGRQELFGGNGVDDLTGGGGADRLEGGFGGDRVRAADGLLDDLVCGPGADQAAADAFDLLISCEAPLP